MPMPRGQFSWVEFVTTDAKAAMDFYSHVVGWTTREMPGGGIFTRTDPGIEPHWLYYFTVDGLTAAIRRVSDKGGRTLEEPMQVPGGGWVVPARDAFGAAFALTSENR